MSEKHRINSIKEAESLVSEIDTIIVITRKNFPESEERDRTITYLVKSREYYSNLRTKLHSDENID